MPKRELPWPVFGSIYDDAEINAVTAILRDCQKSRRTLDSASEEIVRFESRLADFVGAKYAVVVNSCGTAIDIATQVIGIKEGDEVITTPNTFRATSLSVLARGGKAVCADIDPKSFNLDPAQIPAKITRRTKAIYPVHYAGLACEMDAIMEIAAKHKLYVVEDAAHAVGTVYQGRKVGSIGHLTCFSFQSQKNMTTLGEGGAITTNDEEFATKARQIRTMGAGVEIGFNNRMTPVQAAVGITQLDKLEMLNEKRRSIAYQLNRRLANVKGLRVPWERKGDKHSYYLYTLLFEDNGLADRRDEFLRLMKEEYGIFVNVLYGPWYRMKVFADRGYAAKQCPLYEDIIRRLINPPIQPEYTEEDIDYLASSIISAIEKLR